MGWELPSPFPISREWLKASHALKGAVKDRRTYPKNEVMPCRCRPEACVTLLQHSNQQVNNPACTGSCKIQVPTRTFIVGWGRKKAKRLLARSKVVFFLVAHSNLKLFL